MTYRLAIRTAAENDLADIRDWYESRKPGLGLEFLTEIDAAIARIVQEPLSYPQMHRDVRRALVPRFPYKLWFRVQPATVVVIACTHAVRGPAFLETRLS